MCPCPAGTLRSEAMSAENPPSGPASLLDSAMLRVTGGDPDAAMTEVVELMRSMSRQTDPQEVVRVYRERARRLVRWDGTIALSRRDLSPPWYRITRYSGWTEEINPWKQKDKLPLLDRGILGELIYGDKPVIVNDFRADASDPAYEYLKGFRSIFAVPQYDGGTALNMTVALGRAPGAFDRATAPVMVWLTNLFGRATANLVLRDQLREAYEALERELRVVAEIQRSLLPVVLPDVKNLELAAHYQTSRHAGGDYYDFFALPEGRVGMLIADVSGHGTPAAVLMAVTHTVAHTHPGPPSTPNRLLTYLNENLSDAFRRTGTGFVTAFYGIYDPVTRAYEYASAGHNPPRLRRSDGRIETLDQAVDLPLGIDDSVRYTHATVRLEPGDLLTLYTDGITEARNPSGELFGEGRLDQALGSCPGHAGGVVAGVLRAVDAFSAGRTADDDRTIVAARAT